MIYHWLIVLMTNSDEVQNVYQFSFLIWCIMFFMGIHRDDQIRVAAYFVFPSFFIYQAIRQVSAIIQYYKTDGKSALINLDTNSILSIITLMVYAFMLTYEQRKEHFAATAQEVKFKSSKLDSLKEKGRVLNQEMIYNLSQFLRITVPAIRYVALLVAIGASLTTINLPNSILMVWSLYLIKNSDVDHIQWPRYFSYIIFLIMNLYIARVVNGKFQTLNAEVVSLFGVYADNTTICRPAVLPRHRQYEVVHVGLHPGGLHPNGM
jgi:hypothetical protein